MVEQASITIRLYGPLNDFVPADRRRGAIAQPLRGHPSVKDVVEAVGVPHPEIDLILVDGEPVGFDYHVRQGDHIAVYPPFTAIDVTSLPRVGPPSLPVPRFVVDTHLGTLARTLRLLGFDTRSCHDDETLARQAFSEERILLTRDRGLLKRGCVTWGYYVRASDPRRQALEVIRRYDLAALSRPFARCLRCNGTLAPVTKTRVIDRLPPRTRQEHDAFWQCAGCGRVYWQGSHYDHMRRFIAGLLAEAAAS